jgi:glutathione synthase/RimK-type ligase-like ATP-grasp enzyme
VPLDIAGSREYCGDGSMRQAAPISPAVHLGAERILVVGGRDWHLRYESADWRKNVGATVTTIAPDPELAARARRTVGALGLIVAGLDYIVSETGATLLEVNAYPGFDDEPAAAAAFVELAGVWWRELIQ